MAAAVTKPAAGARPGRGGGMVNSKILGNFTPKAAKAAPEVKTVVEAGSANGMADRVAELIGKALKI